MKEKIILVTGAAGFIGFHLCKRLLERGCRVIGLDNLNGYYSVQLKLDRLKQLGILEVTEGELVLGEKFREDFQFIKLDLENRNELPQLFKKFKFTSVCNLAAQAGVRYSIENPNVYIDSNIMGFANLLECMRHANVKKLVYASSSSVYGMNDKVPFETSDPVDHPVSLYAVTKKSNELMAYTYSHLFNMQTIGLRYFNVFGRQQDPNGAYAAVIPKFVMQFMKHESPVINGDGTYSRDFTYIDNVIQMNLLAITTDNEEALNEVYNTAVGDRTTIKDMAEQVREYLSVYDKKIKEIEIKHGPNRQGDVPHSLASIDKAQNKLNYKPSHVFAEGLKEAVDWCWENLG